MLSHIETPALNDVYEFKGLEGETNDNRVMTIYGISVSGLVSYKLDLEGFEPSIHSASLTEVLTMIDRQIWVKK